MGDVVGSDTETSASSEEEEDDEDALPAAAPPVQKISLSGPVPLPRSFTTFDDLLPKSSSSSSSSSSVINSLRTNLRTHGIHNLWGVQGAVAGALLDQQHKRDALVIAPTGSGKTLSYLIPLVLRLGKPCRTGYKAFKAGGGGGGSSTAATQGEQGEKAPGQGQGQGQGEQGVRSIIVLPTHELAVQIYNEVLKLCHGRGHGHGSGQSAWRTILLEKSTEKAVVDSTRVGDEDGGVPPLGIDILVATPERLHKLVEEGLVQLHE